MKRFFSGRAQTVVLVLAATAVLWEILVRLFDVQAFLLPAPSLVFKTFFAEPKLYLLHSAYTLQSTLLGFALAVVVGVMLAVAIVQSKFVEQTVYTLLVSLNSIPKAAMAPLFIIWLGTGLESKVGIAFLIAVFAIVIDTVHGLRSVEPEMLDLGRALQGSRLQVLLKIQFPHALPSIFAGMKVGISLSLIGAIVGEFVSSRQGLGYSILVAQGQFDTASMFVAFVILSILGTALFYGLEILEHVLLPWHVSRRRTPPVAGQP